MMNALPPSTSPMMENIASMATMILPCEYSSTPERMPMSSEEMTSLVHSASTIAMIGGRTDTQV